MNYKKISKIEELKVGDILVGLAKSMACNSFVSKVDAVEGDWFGFESVNYSGTIFTEAQKRNFLDFSKRYMLFVIE